MEEQKKKSGAGAGFLGGICTGVLVTLLLVCTVALGIQLQKAEAEAKKNREEQQNQQEVENFANDKEHVLANLSKKMEEVFDIIDKEYYQDEDIDWQALSDGAFHGVMEAIGDPYSTYYSIEELESFLEDTDGEYYGIGAYVMYDTELKYPVVSKPIAGSPAEEAGLAPEDVILAVNGTSTYEMSDLDDVVAMIKGEAGTTVELTVRRGDEKLTFTLERRKVELESVTGEMFEDGMAYIQITSFDKVTPGQFKSNMEKLRSQGMKGLILDLRGNPGGSLTSVVEIARSILPEGMIVSIVDKYGKSERYTCKGKTPFEFPLVVLIDKGSASASELLSGAIKDLGAGTLIGTTSFGKGIVQDVILLDDGSAIKTTTSKYYTPNGINIHGTGIDPDITVELDVDAYLNDGYDNQLEKAKEVLREKMNRK